nr:hypothetical protein CFP56_56930 [Quercus suber]
MEEFVVVAVGRRINGRKEKRICSQAAHSLVAVLRALTYLRHGVFILVEQTGSLWWGAKCRGGMEGEGRLDWWGKMTMIIDQHSNQKVELTLVTSSPPPPEANPLQLVAPLGIQHADSPAHQSEPDDTSSYLILVAGTTPHGPHCPLSTEDSKGTGWRMFSVHVVCPITRFHPNANADLMMLR